VARAAEQFAAQRNDCQRRKPRTEPGLPADFNTHISPRRGQPV